MSMQVKDSVLPLPIIEQCGEIYFRQSMISDILTCPQMALYRWVLNMEESQPFFSAILGTAGHACIYAMHNNRKFDYSYIELLEMFTSEFDKELAKLDKIPAINKAFSSIEEQRDNKCPEYISMLMQYQKDERNHGFYSVINEQSFVLQVDNPSNLPGSVHNTKPFIFTGQIDQGGYYESGQFALRDIKFRDNAFRPAKSEFDINTQMTIYAAALRFGKPVCKECKPYYETDPLNGSSVLHYNGPCETCKKKVGTEEWPNRYADRCELIWMRDYETYSKDEFPMRIKDPAKSKTINPKTGRMVIAEVINPKYTAGYKLGDKKGPGYILTYRTPSKLEVLMANVIQICDNIRHGKFWRNPGKHCGFWCKHTDQCRDAIEIEVEQADLANVASYASDDPF